MEGVMTRTKEVAVFIGTRPEAIKMAPVIRALERADSLTPIVVSTGQHREMLRQVMDVFGISVHTDLDVMTPDQSLAGLSSRIMARVDAFLAELQPDFSLVQGDTTTVLMAALASFYRGIPLGHVEAGLRTGNIHSPFPEEANRRLVSPIATIHYAPTEPSAANLRREGVPDDQILVTGNTSIDALRIESDRQSALESKDSAFDNLDHVLGGNWRDRPFVLITGHRRENLGKGFDRICCAIQDLAAAYPNYRFIYPVHLNPRVSGPVMEQLGGLSNVVLMKPVSYCEFIALMRHSRIILTDSGGVQEEAPGLGKPVLVMRDTTERPEGVDSGVVRLVGTSRSTIVDGVSELLDNDDVYARMSVSCNPYGDGYAAERISASLASYLGD